MKTIASTPVYGHLKTTVHKHKKHFTQIVKTVIGYVDKPLFGQWKINEKGKKVPKTWQAPVIKTNVIHHYLR